MWIFSWFLALFSGLRRCLASGKSRPAAGDRDHDVTSVSVESSSSSVNAADSAGGVFHDAQPTTLSTGSVCFMPACERDAPTPCSLRAALYRTSLPKQPAAVTTGTGPQAAVAGVSLPDTTPVPSRPALADISNDNNIPAQTSVTEAGSVASCCPSPLDDFVTPEAQPTSAWGRYIINSGKQVVGVANTERRYTEDKPLPAHTTPYPLRLEKELEKAVKVQERLATSREP